MGVKAKKALSKKLRKASSDLAVSRRRNESSDFLPLEGGPGKKIPEPEEPVIDTSTVLYIGRIPHGFYEDQMEGFFKQFGKIRRLRIARNKKVAKVVADEIHDYLRFEHQLQIHLIPPVRVHPKLWIGVNRIYRPPNWREIERKRLNKERTVEEHQRLVNRIVKRDEKHRKRIEAAGIDYECPAFVGRIQSTPKKIRFHEEA